MHPIAVFRQKRGLTRTALALAAGVGYQEVFRAERGYMLRVHPRLAAWLRENGYPGDPQDDHARWREEQRVRITGR